MIRLSVKPNDESLHARDRDSAEDAREKAQSVPVAGRGVSRELGRADLSACRTTSPVIISVGMFLVNMSTTKIREVTDSSPPDR